VIDDDTDVKVPLTMRDDIDENTITEEEGREVAERLGIDIEKWEKEIIARLDATSVPRAGRITRPLTCVHMLNEADCPFCPVDRELKKEGLL
jgi:hypothetical protein